MDFRAGRIANGSRDPSTIPDGNNGASGPPIRTGDMVVFFEGREAIGFDRIKDKGIWQCRHGAFHHDDMLMKPFGSRVFSRSSKGFVYALSPTPELWSQVVPNRTQIVQDFDQSIVIFRLDLKPGDVVVESGTGSGVMSSSIMRTIAPTGFLHTFEFNEIRATTAREEFARNGLGHLVNVVHRDICASKEEGGGFGHGLDGKADAVFLDLPEPWLAVSHAKSALKSGKQVCSYSPCIEQAMKTCEALRSAGFHSVTTIEFRLRTIGHMGVRLEVPDFGYATPVVCQDIKIATSIAAHQATSGKPGVSELGDAMKMTEEDDVKTGVPSKAKDECGKGDGEKVVSVPVGSVVHGESHTEAPAETLVHDCMTNGELVATDQCQQGIPAADPGSPAIKRGVGVEEATVTKDTSEPVSIKRPRCEAESKEYVSSNSAKSSGPGNKTTNTKRAVRTTENDRRTSPPKAAGIDGTQPPVQLVCAQPFPIMRGHTAFLTFATTPVSRGGDTGSVIDGDANEARRR